MPLLQYIPHVMQSVESLDGLKYLDTGSHIFWTMEHGMMRFHFVDIVKNTTPWALHLKDHYALDGGCYIVGWFDTMQI
jgi:hypothetical protein